MGVLIEGERTILYHNYEHKHIYDKKYTVYGKKSDGMWVWLDKEEYPTYQFDGWDSLEEAKVFYLLHEI